MGNPVSTLRENIEAQKALQQQQKQEMQERIHILERMVKSRLENEKTTIFEGTGGDQEINTGTVVELHQQINLKESGGSDQSISKGINAFFSGDLIGGLEDIVQAGAKSVLGNASIGEYETTDMFIVWSENALLRCDAYYYRWNFVSSGVVTDKEGAIGVLLVKRVIDLSKTDPQVLTYAITNMASRLKPPQDAGPLIDKAVAVMEKVAMFQAKVRAIEAGASSDGHGK